MRVATKLSELEHQILVGVWQKFEGLHGRQHSTLGQIVIRSEWNACRIIMLPNKSIELACLGGGQWRVAFVDDEVDTENWEQTGAFAHVMNSFRGCILQRLLPVLDLEQIVAVIKL